MHGKTERYASETARTDEFKDRAVVLKRTKGKIQQTYGHDYLSTSTDHHVYGRASGYFTDNFCRSVYPPACDLRDNVSSLQWHERQLMLCAAPNKKKNNKKKKNKNQGNANGDTLIVEHNDDSKSEVGDSVGDGPIEEMVRLLGTQLCLVGAVDAGQ